MRRARVGVALALLGLGASLALNLFLLRHHLTPTKTAQAQFFPTGHGQVIVVLADSVLESMFGRNWRDKALFFEVSGWLDLKEGTGMMHEPRFLDPLLASGLPLLTVPAHDTIDVGVLCLDDKKYFGVTIDLTKHSVDVGTSVVSRAEYVLQRNGSLEYRRPRSTTP